VCEARGAWTGGRVLYRLDTRLLPFATAKMGSDDCVLCRFVFTLE
jgi:hypothetical protein